MARVRNDNYTTPLAAFQDLVAFLPKHPVCIYDPFYNDGKSREYMQTAFPGCTIIHENKDAFSWLPEDFWHYHHEPTFQPKEQSVRMASHVEQTFHVVAICFGDVQQVISKTTPHRRNPVRLAEWTIRLWVRDNQKITCVVREHLVLSYV